jgi:hypothetical protein
MHPPVLITVALLLSATLSACSIRKHDEIECGLPDGSSFILRSSYDWYPLARFVPHAAERLNSTGFSTYYRPARGGAEIHAAGGLSRGEIIPKYNDIKFIAQLCSAYGTINGVPYILSQHYKPPGAYRYYSINVQDRLFRALIFGGTAERSQFKDVDESGMRFGRSAIVWRPNLLVMEKSLIAKDAPHPAPVIGAYRIESHDGGQTWGNPHLTREPEVFELGKPATEQCFVARLVRIDGRRFKSDFPDCPVARVLPDR